MKIYALTGKSGTGKSYNALELCARLQIPALIDDGLFIFENTIVAGISAKKQPTKIGAIKTALFSDEQIRKKVASAIKYAHPSAVLILGTSDEMADRIAEALELPKPEEYIHIEDIASSDSIKRAKEAREEGGMHVIPAPTMQLKKQFSGYFLNAKKNFAKRPGEQDGGKTIVRPTYSYMGKYEISDKVISDIVAHIIEISDGADSLLWAATSKQDDGIYIRAIVLAKWHTPLKKLATSLQKQIYDAVAYTTAFNVLGVEVEIWGYKL